MSKEEELVRLRELFQSAPIPANTLLLGLATGVLLLGVVLWLVRRRSLREEYTPIWLITAISILAISVWTLPLSWLTRMTGAWTHSSTLFFIALVFLFFICLNYAVRLSKLTLQLKNLSQEVTLLRAELRQDPGQSRSGCAGDGH